MKAVRTLAAFVLSLLLFLLGALACLWAMNKLYPVPTPDNHNVMIIVK